MCLSTEGIILKRIGGNIMINLNEIVKGKKAGIFVVVGFRTIDGEPYAQVKSVNPSDYSQVAIGEMALPIASIERV